MIKMEQIELTATVHEEAGSYWAEVAELPGCFASGHDLDELKEALTEAIGMCLPDIDNRGPVRSIRLSAMQMAVGCTCPSNDTNAPS